MIQEVVVGDMPDPQRIYRPGQAETLGVSARQPETFEAAVGRAGRRVECPVGTSQILIITEASRRVDVRGAPRSGIASTRRNTRFPGTKP